MIWTHTILDKKQRVRQRETTVKIHAKENNTHEIKQLKLKHVHVVIYS